MSDSNFSAIRARLRYESIEEFIDGYARFISAGGMFIPMAPNKLKPNGTTIRFQFLIADGTTALLGEGQVVQVRPPDENNPKAPVGMLIKFSKLSQESKNLVDQIMAMKEFGGIGGEDAERSDASPSEESEPEEQVQAAEHGIEDEEGADPTYETNLQDFMAGQAEPEAEEEAESESESEPEPEVVEAAAAAPADESEHELQLDAQESTHGPRKLAQTEGGLQILAFDDMSAEEADGMDLDIGAEESDIDEMFAGLFGGGGDEEEDDGGMFGVFGGSDEEEPAAEAPQEAELVEESEEELVEESEEEELAEESEEEELAEESEEEELAEESEEEELAEPSEELAEPSEEEELAEESEEEELAAETPAEDENPLPMFEDDPEGSSLSFPSDWDHDEDAGGVEEKGDEPESDGPAFEDEDAGEDDDLNDGESIDLDLESDVELIEGSEAELLIEHSEGAPAEMPPAPSSPAIEVSEDSGPSELENLLGNLESGADDEQEMDLHLANDPLARFEEESEPAASVDDDDEASLDFLLAAASRDIAAKHSEEDAEKKHDILDDLLGEDANLPPPPSDQPVFGAGQAQPEKKKGGFLSKLFGKD